VRYVFINVNLLTSFSLQLMKASLYS